jgi:hypothetical protein
MGKINSCHPERGEGSLKETAMPWAICQSKKIFHYVQNDTNLDLVLVKDGRCNGLIRAFYK